jgi:hypothetical protein
MAKWEYLRFTTSSSSSIFSKKSFLSICPASKVNLQWLAKNNPSAKQDLPKASNDVLNIYPKADDGLRVYWSIIDYLGAEGWEPFCVEHDPFIYGITIHFKRNK